MKTYTLIFSLLMGTTIASAADFSSASNPYFIIAILLFVILIGLAMILPTVIKSLARQVREKKKSALLALITLGAGAESFASGELVDSSLIQDLDAPAVMLIIAAIVLAATFITMFKTIFKLTNFLKTDEELAKEGEDSAISSLMKIATDNVPLDKEDDILLDHEYDGIKELDNNLPPWWVAFFYITIVFAVVYIFQMHISNSMPHMADEYNNEIAAAEEALNKFKESSTNFIDENNVVLLDDAASREIGKKLYQASCAACHGNEGQGLVGPNFTDNYWIHGGSVKDVFSTIKYGVPDKGMIAWKSQLKGPQMQKIASYILLDLVGTTPANPKAAEGELYVPETEEAPAASEETPAEETPAAE
ncbi:MAG: MFS transporter [Flavobacteriales bacterium]|nr:MFS transporter [Flavobacteriales bacterium]